MVQQQIAKTPKKLTWDDLPNERKLQQLKPSRKVLLDTVKMFAYRAENAMVNIIREKLARHDDVRALVRDLCASEADVIPDEEAGHRDYPSSLHGQCPLQSCRPVSA